MSVRRRPNSKFFQYRFKVDGVTYAGSTKETAPAKARQFEALMLAKARRGELNPELRKAPLLSEFAATFLTHVSGCEAANTLDHDTGRTYRNGWRLLSVTRVTGMRLDKIGTKDADTLTFPGSASNANQALRTLRRILSYACEVGALRAAPRIKLREEQGRSAVIEPWIEDLMLECAGDTLRDVLTIILDCGARPEEVCRMRWEHMRWTESALLIPHGKSLRARRFVGMTDRMRDVLRARENDGEWVFPCLTTKAGKVVALSGHVSPTSAGGKMWRTMLAKVAEKCAERNLSLPPGLVLYCARHTFATRYLANGGELSQLKKLMGHGSITTTEKYLHPSIADAAEVMNKHNRRRGLSLVKTA